MPRPHNPPEADRLVHAPPASLRVAPAPHGDRGAAPLFHFAVDPPLAAIIEALAPLHDRLCPRQVLGARIGLQGRRLLGVRLPPTRGDTQLLTFIETDGCFADGVAAATGSSVGHRTMRIVDLGKVAATFVDTLTERAVRVWPRPEARDRALAYVPDVNVDRWLAQRDGYLCMAVDELLLWRDVRLTDSVAEIMSRAGLRVRCGACGEEVINGREVYLQGRAHCRACAGQDYLRPSATSNSACPAGFPQRKRRRAAAGLTC